MQLKLKYKLLAFATLTWQENGNGVIQLQKQSDYKSAMRLGLNKSTFIKYKNICLQESILKIENGSVRFRKVVEILHILNDLEICKKNLLFNKFFIFKAGFTNKRTFKQIYKDIVKEVMIKNYCQQGFNINEKIRIVKTVKGLATNDGLIPQLTKSEIKNLTKKARDLKITFDEYIRTLEKDLLQNNNVVSGKNHVAKMTGFCATTGLKLLNGFDKDTLVRKIQYVRACDINGVPFGLNVPIEIVAEQLQNPFIKRFEYRDKQVDKKYEEGYFYCPGSVIKFTREFLLNRKETINFLKEAKKRNAWSVLATFKLEVVPNPYTTITV